ncbi:MFS transporter [Aliamphritea hakodatensis]|uniref:MFS transporter n=1 Tax=Aliamphritea hakodatensis TaxID=2895352 RepID=UPI0022FD93F8|nr:MFS transporter [Aliamphritea hakodatensis]
MPVSSASEISCDNSFGAGFRLALVLLCTAIIIATFGFGLYLFSALATDMRQDLGFSYTAVGSMIALAQLGFLGASLGSSALVPRWGEIRVVLSAAALCGVSLLLLGLASEVWLIALLLVVLAACAAAAWTPMVGLIARYIDYQHRAKAMGLIGSGTSYGIFINGLVLPWLLPDYGWRPVWFVLGGLTLLITLLAAVVMLRQQKAPVAAEQPGILSQLPLLREARPWGLLTGVFLAGISFIAFMNYLAMYARDDRQLSVQVCGDLLMIIGAVGMFAGVICGILADRLGIRPVITLMCLAFLIAAALVSADADIPGLYVAAGLFGSAYVGYFAMVPAYIGKRYPAALATSLFGGANFAMAGGAMLGNFLGGWSKTLLGNFSAVYLSAGVIAVVLIVLTLRLQKESG